MDDALNIDALALQIADAVRAAAEAAGLTVAIRHSHADSSYLTLDGVRVRISSHRAMTGTDRADFSVIVRPPDGEPWGGADASSDIWFARCRDEEIEIEFDAEVDGVTEMIREIEHRRVYWMPEQDALVAEFISSAVERAADLKRDVEDND